MSNPYKKSIWIKEDTARLLNRVKARLLKSNIDVTNISDDMTINKALSHYLRGVSNGTKDRPKYTGS